MRRGQLRRPTPVTPRGRLRHRRPRLQPGLPAGRLRPAHVQGTRHPPPPPSTRRRPGKLPPPGQHADRRPAPPPGLRTRLLQRCARRRDHPPRSPRLGVQFWAEIPLAGRGLLIDIQDLLRDRGRPPAHIDGPALTTDLLDEALQRQGSRVEPGDLLLVHTGWAHWYLDTTPEQRAETRAQRRATGFAQHRALAAWCWDHRLALMATDTFAVEVLPVLAGSDFRHSAPEDDGMMHQELITRLGLPLGELRNLHALAEDCRTTGRRDSLLTVKPLNLTGGVGSPANATALR
ncbi:cyclase family protein [Streptomyces sp. NPDC004596]